MKVMYNLTGDRRKELVKAVVEVVGRASVYQGAPTFAYLVPPYVIDKQGTLSVPVGFDMDTFERLLEQLYMKGFLYDARESDELEDIAPVDDANGAQPTEVGEPEPESEQASTPESDRFTIELPLGGLTDAQLLNLERLIASKASLIKKSLGTARLTVERFEDKLTFPWFDSVPNRECISAYARFIGALYVAAKRQKRVQGTERLVESERFAFRTFLLRLGFGGPEYAAERKILLRNLSGSSAFPNAAKAIQHTDRWRERRDQQQAARLSNQTEVDAE